MSKGKYPYRCIRKMRKHPATGFVFVSNLDYLMWQWYMCDTAESIEAKDPTDGTPDVNGGYVVMYFILSSPDMFLLS